MYYEKITRLNNFCSYLSHIHYSHSSQTLTLLHLFGNNIGDEGVQCLAIALKSNTVSIESCNWIRSVDRFGLSFEKRQVLLSSYFLTQYSSNEISSVSLSNYQVLSKLNLGENNISDTGVCYLADTLKTNTV
jgi:hypothetical protein